MTGTSTALSMCQSPQSANDLSRNCTCGISAVIPLMPVSVHNEATTRSMNGKEALHCYPAGTCRCMITKTQSHAPVDQQRAVKTSSKNGKSCTRTPPAPPRSPPSLPPPPRPPTRRRRPARELLKASAESRHALLKTKGTPSTRQHRKDNVGGLADMATVVKVTSPRRM